MSFDPKPLSSFHYRSILALAEALMPGSRTVPAADEETVRYVTEIVHHLHPQLEKAWNIANSVLSAAAIVYTGRPFHKLSVPARDALLRRWEDNPVLRVPIGLLQVAYKLAHFDTPPTYAALGGKLNVVQSMESPRWLEQVHRADSWPEGDDVECEVVVIGTGAGGAVVGRELAERGFAVAFVEEGQHYRRDSFDGSSMRAHLRFYRAAFSIGNAIMPVFVGRLVGGSTAINTGTSFRTPPWILDRWCEQMGTDEFSPAAMKRHFERVEHELQVAPAEQKIIGPIGEIMARGCDAMGWSHGPVHRNAPECDGSGFCDYGCRTDARRGTNISYVPPALQSGAVLFTGLRADRILIEGGRAVGVTGVTKAGRRMNIRAQAVVLAGGAIPTPLLLLKQGIANRSGQVGRNLSLHPSGALMALFEQKVNGKAYAPQGYLCDEFERDGEMILSAQPDANGIGLVLPFAGRRLMEVADQMDYIGSFGLLLRDTSANGRVWRDVQGFPVISYNVQPEDVARVHRAMVHAGEMSLAAGAKKLYPVAMGVPVLEGRKGLDAFRKTKLSAGDVLWTSYHPLGTAKMGKDPKTSVIGLDHQSHDVPGLYIVDASAVPGPLGVNPQITIMAMANRASERISEQLGGQGVRQIVPESLATG
jgi:choline dehydrogenase-like flavoprotein